MLKICIDPGHGGTQPGAVNGGVKEKDLALRISLKIGERLKKNGVEVVYTRTNDNVEWPREPIKDLGKRCEISNRAGANYFVSIHLNSALKKSVNGIETYCLAHGGKGEKLAIKIQEELIKATGASNRGVKTAKYYVLRNTHAPAVLVEIGFISNHDELKKLLDESYQDIVASAIERGILNCFNIPLKKNTYEYFVYGVKNEKYGPYLNEAYAKNKCDVLSKEGYTEIYYVRPDGSKVSAANKCIGN